jgi:hypothetical protein
LVLVVLSLYEIGSVHIINANAPAKHGADMHAVEQRETSHVWLTISFGVRYIALVTRQNLKEHQLDMTAYTTSVKGTKKPAVEPCIQACTSSNQLVSCAHEINGQCNSMRNSMFP